MWTLAKGARTLRRVHKTALEVAKKLEEPDQVPYDFYVEREFIAGYIGMTVGEYYANLDRTIEANIKVQKKFLGEVRSIDYGLGGLTQASTFGCKMFYNENAIYQIKEPLIKSLEDIDKLEAPDPLKDGLMPEMFKRYNYVKKKVGNKYPVGYPIPRGSQGPFTTAALLRGLLPLLADIGRNPEMVHKLLRFITDAAIAQIRIGEELNDNPEREKSIGMADDFAGYLSPRLYEEFVLPYNKRIYETFDGDRNYHSESLTAKHLPFLLEMGVASFLGDTREMYHTVKDLKRCIGHKVFISAFIDNMSVITHGTPQTVAENVKRAMRDGAPGGGFELSVDLCNWPVPIENIETFMKAAEKYGRYPIKL